MKKIRFAARIAVGVTAVALWIGFAWIAFSPDETWTQYRRDCAGFLTVTLFVLAMIATVPIS